MACLATTSRHRAGDPMAQAHQGAAGQQNLGILDIWRWWNCDGVVQKMEVKTIENAMFLLNGNQDFAKDLPKLMALMNQESYGEIYADLL